MSVFHSFTLVGKVRLEVKSTIEKSCVHRRDKQRRNMEDEDSDLWCLKGTQPLSHSVLYFLMRSVTRTATKIISCRPRSIIMYQPGCLLSAPELYRLCTHLRTLSSLCFTRTEREVGRGDVWCHQDGGVMERDGFAHGGNRCNRRRRSPVAPKTASPPSPVMRMLTKFRHLWSKSERIRSK